MKRIIRYFIVFIIGGVFLTACEQPDSNWDAAIKDYNANNPTHYVSFGAGQDLENKIAPDGSPALMVTDVEVLLFGSPQGSDITVNLSVDPTSTATSSQFTLESNSIVIPAGESSATTTLTGISSEIEELQTVTVVLNMDAGGVEAATANQVTYSLKRIKFCEWAVDDMVGDYKAAESEGVYNTNATGTVTISKVDDAHIHVAGLGFSLYVSAWGEAVTSGDTVLMTVNPDGTLSFENQYLCQTDDVWDYYMGPASAVAKWDGCVKSFILPWYFHWDDAYGDNILFTTTLTQ